MLRISRENQIPRLEAFAITILDYANPHRDMKLNAMRVRRRIQNGMVADITFFEPRNEGRFAPRAIEGRTREFHVAPVDFDRGVPGSQPDVHQRAMIADFRRAPN